MSGPTPGTVTGTKVVVFEGGPPQWNGHVTGISKTGSGRAERWDEVSGETIVYIRTDRTAQVPLERQRRTGTVVEMKTAAVYAYAGYKEDL